MKIVSRPEVLVARRVVLVIAVLAAVGFGFGWIGEDLCCIGGAFADDPSTPVVAAEFALPSHLQAAPKAALPGVTAAAASEVQLRIGPPATAPQDQPAGRTSLQNPRRC